MWEKKMVYVLTAFFAEDAGFEAGSEEFFAETLEEAEQKKAELLEDDRFEEVWISDEKQEREIWTV